MPDLPYDEIQTAFAAQPLFEGKVWQFSPDAWRLTPEQLEELEGIGAACLEFHRALENLYLRAIAGKNLLRNKPLTVPWVMDYLERGKPAALLEHARDPRNRGRLPAVLRPDLLLTDEGFAMTELDSVPGGIGLTAFLNRLYEPQGGIVGAGDAMLNGFYTAQAGLRPGVNNPVIALVVSEEAGTYRPEMEWLAQQLQRQGRRVFCVRPEKLFPLGGALHFDRDGTPEKIDVVYRFFELFDLPNLPCTEHILTAWKAGEVEVSPPMRPWQEEKLALALFHHHLLQDYWQEALGKKTLKRLQALIPPSWVLDPAVLPPGAVLDGPKVGGRAISDWRELAGASQKERELIIKISGYHETAWGARSVVLGSDVPKEEWQRGIERALELAPHHPHVLQTYRKPRRVRHRIYTPEKEAREAEGRLRLCPYYFVTGEQAKLGGALATFCPPDKKIIHGMEDAALLPCRVTPAPE